MRRVGTLLLASFLLVSRPGLAQEGAGARLYGSWRLVSFQMQVVGEDAPPRDVFGPNPFGRLILTPEHTMAAYLSRPDRRPPSNEAEAATLLASMNAYTGRFRLEGDRFITAVDGAWNEIFKGTEQVRHFTLEGDRLSIRTPEQPSATLPGKRVVSTLLWVRER